MLSLSSIQKPEAKLFKRPNLKDAKAIKNYWKVLIDLKITEKD